MNTHNNVLGLFLFIIIDWGWFNYSAPWVNPFHVNNDQNGVNHCRHCNCNWKAIYQFLGQQVGILLLWKAANSWLNSVVSLDDVTS